MGMEDELPSSAKSEATSNSTAVSQSGVEQASGSSLSSNRDSSGLAQDDAKPVIQTGTLTSDNVNEHCLNGASQECGCVDDDNTSDVSELSDLSHEAWQPVQGPISWVHEQMRKGQSPRSILEKLVPKGTIIPEGLDIVTLWKIIISIVSEPPKRKKLEDINTLDDVIRLLKTCKKIIVLTGAGVSVSCGIPDFRSKDGVYARLAKDFPNLPDPQAMFDIHFFRSDPRPFYKFAKEIYPGQFKPSLCHHFIRLLETKGKLLRNYTQNIDTLEQEAGIESVVQCHGSFATASCAVCGNKVDSSVIKEDIFNQVIPKCPICPPSDEMAVMKPDIVFFGESLPEHFHNLMTADKEECDLLIVIGSSLKVRPVALIPNSLPAGVPQILINRERLHYLNFDTELLGNCDNIVAELCRRLGDGWNHLVSEEPLLEQVLLSNLPTPPASPGQPSDGVGEEDETGVSSSSNAGPQSTPSSSINVVNSSASSSHAGPSAAKVSTKDHHHPHLKNSLKLAPSLHADEPQAVESVSSSSASAGSSGANQQGRKEDMDRLVSAGHRKDVVYEPSKQGSGTSHHHYHHHHPHHQQQHESTSSHVIHLRDTHGHHVSQAPQPISDCDKTSHELQPPNNSFLQQHSTQAPESTQGVLPGFNMEPSASSSSSEKKRLNDGLSVFTGENGEGEPEVKKQKLSGHSHIMESENTSTSECTHKDETNMPVESESSSFKASLNIDSKDDYECVDNMEGEEIAGAHDGEIGDDIDLQAAWSSRPRTSIADRLGTNQMLFIPPSRYIFKGAEVYSDESESEDDDDTENDDNVDQEDNVNNVEGESSSREVEEVGQKSFSGTSSDMPSAVESSASEEKTIQDTKQVVVQNRLAESSTGLATGIIPKESSNSIADADCGVVGSNFDVPHVSGTLSEKADCVVSSTEDLS
ncbi:NAD-dependent protein deacetylase sirtuin-1 [Elysia marginata]|uniref:protein acetyllysine N-acetyltransferase n=1 Tax=Elysia marginata TaxID=1093978 RepID=A0AAV4G0Y2_9GAST|nr:NAD-dependent protein deacetylase sirtuin-1 [Elysia marginata]